MLGVKVLGKVFLGVYVVKGGVNRGLLGVSQQLMLCTSIPLRECLQGCTPARRTACFFAELLFTGLGCLGALKERASSILGLDHTFLSQPPNTSVPLPFTQCCPTAKMAPVRRAPYKDFLQPALHRRFTSTATILLAIAFVESVVLASWNSRQSCPAPAATLP